MIALDPRLISHDWIMKNVFGFSEKEIQTIGQYAEADALLRSIPPSPNVVAELQLEKAIQDHDQGVRPS